MHLVNDNSKAETVKIWDIPELVAHSAKIYIIQNQPLAKNVSLTASYTMTLKIYDLDTLNEKYGLRGTPTRSCVLR